MKKKLIEDYQPDVIFVGDDWTPATFSGEGLGVPVVYLPHTPGIRSTEISHKHLWEVIPSISKQGQYKAVQCRECGATGIRDTRPGYGGVTIVKKP